MAQVVGTICLEPHCPYGLHQLALGIQLASQFPIQVDAGEGRGGAWPPQVGSKWPPWAEIGSKIGDPVVENTAIRIVIERIIDGGRRQF